MRLHALLLATIALTPPAPAQTLRPLIRPGEELRYSVSSARLGKLGTAAFKVEEAMLEGVPVYQISFDFNAKVAIFNISDRTRSWVRRDSLTVVRYSKHERSPLGKRDEDVVVDYALGQWRNGQNRAPLDATNPMDELSFIYLVRSMSPELTGPVDVRRHFDVRRNPVSIEALRRDVVDGRNVVVYVMRAPDSRQKSGHSTIRFFISDDAARIPLRIESTMPVAGAITMTLTSAPGLPVVADR